jgi:hypothetical protein
MANVLRDLPAVGKGKRNTDQQFNFRGIDDVVNALHECLAEHQVFYLPSTLERLTEVRQTRSGASLWVVHLHVAFTFFAVDGSNVTADTWGEGVDMADKATSKAHTFAQKSCLLEAFNVATADMVDPDATGEESRPPEPADPEQWFKDNGWARQAEHDEWRAPRVAKLKEIDPIRREGFKAWCAQNKVPGFAEGAHTRDQAKGIDGYLEAAGLLEAHKHEYDEEMYCVVCGEAGA